MLHFSKLFLTSLTSLYSFKECVHSLLLTPFCHCPLSHIVSEYSEKNTWNLCSLLVSMSPLSDLYNNIRENLANERSPHDTPILTQSLFLFLYQLSSRLYMNNYFGIVKNRIFICLLLASLLDITLYACFKLYYIHNYLLQ